MTRYTVAERRELLIQATLRIIAADGVQAATTRAICREAGMAQASFHYAFRSRDALLAAAVQYALDDDVERTADALIGVLPEETDLPTLVHNCLAAYVESVIADPNREQAVLALMGYARSVAELRPIAEQTYRKYYELAANALQAAADLTGVPWRTEVTDLAPVVIAATDGITLAYLSTRDRAIAELIAGSAAQTLLMHAAVPADEVLG
ncbi:TetR/AcrR family transcriptional regulator [Branchiibius cervicis]|uniref:TetR/AcrR family transcriptional regulator n=1 Tax=Branchiibius cervicis TaxID=908252 RepID=A0ABW2AS15_9MICO